MGESWANYTAGKPIVSRTATVVNAKGLHLRPLDLFVKRANQFEAHIEVIRDNTRVAAKSILDVMALGAEKGTQLTVVAQGPDAQAAVDALVQLIESDFAHEENETP